MNEQSIEEVQEQAYDPGEECINFIFFREYYFIFLGKAENKEDFGEENCFMIEEKKYVLNEYVFRLGEQENQEIIEFSTVFLVANRRKV